jgi:16S rRNA (uracil1498-N3)-methyltransferase
MRYGYPAVFTETRAAQSMKIRLYVDRPLEADARFELELKQYHYLHHVMRQEEGVKLRLFNGRDGEWLGLLAKAGKNTGEVRVETKLRPQAPSPDLWLIFAPVKRLGLDVIVAKATELGVARLQPVLTRRVAVARINLERLRAIAREAAEQSERLDVPEIRSALSLAELLGGFPSARRLFFCDERGLAKPADQVLAQAKPGPAAVLIGPEGGFAPDEAELIRRQETAVPLHLGPRLLKADTAAIAALALWQARCGDWAMGRQAD